MIHHGNCLDILPTLEANSVDAVITDPPYGLSFMGKNWDHGIPGVEFWKAAFRVIKPGAHLLAFGGTRTFHRLTCAIEDAGFQIRDCMMWLYGSGFPKSHDVSKAIDKAAGAEREVVGYNDISRRNKPENLKERRDGLGSMCGKGAIRTPEEAAAITAPSTAAARQWSGWGTALKPAWEPIIVARKPIEGTVAENVLKWGTGGMNIEASRIESCSPVQRSASHGIPFGEDKYPLGEGRRYQSNGRWPANVILDEEAGKVLDAQSGTLKTGGGDRSGVKSSQWAGELKATPYERPFTANSGRASRFFYCAKTSKRERGEGNNHPTVKPISLLTYLAKLVCPPGGTILDPFMGSGSMGVAAQNLEFEFIGIEKDAAYVEISKKRLDPFTMVA